MVSNVDFGRILIRISKYIKQMSVRAVMSTRVAAEPGSGVAFLFRTSLHLFSPVAPMAPPAFFLFFHPAFALPIRRCPLPT